MKIIMKHKNTDLGKFCEMKNKLGFDVVSFDCINYAEEYAEAMKVKEIYKTKNHYNVLITVI